jgi:adenine-specific DNA-methyltransferase
MSGLADEKARPNLHYELINPETGVNYGKPKQGWRFDRNRMASLIAEKSILWPEKPTGRPRVKVFLEEMKSDFTGYSSIIGSQIFTYHGTREIESILGSRAFDFPKPSNLILELVRQGAANKNLRFNS